jgi:hypothetical protein
MNKYSSVSYGSYFSFSDGMSWIEWMWDKNVGKYFDEDSIRGGVVRMTYDEYGNVISDTGYDYDGGSVPIGALGFFLFDAVGSYFESPDWTYEYKYEGRHVFYKPLN